MRASTTAPSQPPKIKRLYDKGAGSKVNVTQTTGTLNNGLVGHWTFDGPDISGTRAKDRSGRENHGTISGAVADSGQIGQALKFINLDDAVSAAAGIIGTGSNSVCAWVKPSRLVDGLYSSIVDNAKFELQIENANRRLVLTNNASLATYANAANNSIQTDVWQYVCGTRTAAGVANLYVNGVLSGTADQAGDSPAASAQNTDIGRYPQGGGNQFFGSIDDVRIYNRVLSAGEIQKLYQQGR